MVNYACAFSQSESGKYFEWIINTLQKSISAVVLSSATDYITFSVDFDNL